jgi:hypothetical protein
MSSKDRSLEGYLPPEVLEFLYKKQFFSINDTIYRGMVLIDGKTNERYVDFVETTKSYVNTVCFEKAKTGDKNMAASRVIQNHELNMMNFFPCNIKGNYRHIYEDLVWNKYSAPIHEPKEMKTAAQVEKSCESTLKLFRHVYSDKIDLALDYATVEFMHPKQPLPVQVLFSTENNTGKSTILLHRRDIYGKNASVMSIENFEDKFNSTVAGKNCVLIDEGELKDPKALIKLKMLVTSPMIMLRDMFRSAVEVPNYAKYYFTTNKEFFAKLDTEDSRFWVSHVPKPTKDDPDLLDKIEKEIPSWLGFLQKRWELRGKTAEGIMAMSTYKKRSRLWFLEADYVTDALLNLKRKGIDIEAKNLLIDMQAWFDSYNSDHPNSSINEIYVNIKTIKDAFFSKNAKVGSSVVKKHLETDLKLKMIVNSKGESKSVRYTDYFGKPYSTPPKPSGSQTLSKNVYLITYAMIMDKLHGTGVDSEAHLDVTKEKQEALKNGIELELPMEGYK